MLTGNPDFIPTGISGFMERKVEIQNLLDFMKIGATTMIPATQKDLSGNEIPVPPNPDGTPAMKPFMNLQVIVRRIGELLKIKDLDELIPEEDKPKEVNPRPNASKTPPPVSYTHLTLPTTPYV